MSITECNIQFFNLPSPFLLLSFSPLSVRPLPSLSPDSSLLLHPPPSSSFHAQLYSVSNDHSYHHLIRFHEKGSNGRVYVHAYGVHVSKEGQRASSPGGQACTTPWTRATPALTIRASWLHEVTWPDLSSAPAEEERDTWGERATLATWTWGFTVNTSF